MAKKRKEKRRRTKISDDIFEVIWYVQRGGAKQEAIDWYCKGIEEESIPVVQGKGNYGCFFAKEPHWNGVIWISYSFGTGAIIHEVNHAVSHLFRMLEMPLNTETEEVFTYYSAWLAKQIVNKLWVK